MKWYENISWDITIIGKMKTVDWNTKRITHLDNSSWYGNETEEYHTYQTFRFPISARFSINDNSTKLFERFYCMKTFLYLLIIMTLARNQIYKDVISHVILHGFFVGINDKCSISPLWPYSAECGISKGRNIYRSNNTRMKKFLSRRKV